MKNIDRALRIRDMLTRHPDGLFAADGVKEIASLAHTARMQTPFNPSQIWLNSRRRSKSGRAFYDCTSPYKFELMLHGDKPVIQLSWELNDRNLCLHCYREGAWENEFFGLPYRGMRVAKMWERKLPPPAFSIELLPPNYGSRRPWYFSGVEW